MMMRTVLFWLLSCLLTFPAAAQTVPPGEEPFSGTASYYARKFQGRRTANGEIFRHDSLTAAHKTLPLGTLVKVTNRNNGKWVVVRINDRMSKRSRHLIDLSRRGARELDFIRSGYAPVSLEVIPTLPVVEAWQQLQADSVPLPDQR